MLQSGLRGKVVRGLGAGHGQGPLKVKPGRIESAQALKSAGAAVGLLNTVAPRRGGCGPEAAQRGQRLLVVAAIGLQAGAGEHGV